VVDVADSVVSFLSHVENVKGRVLVHCLAGVSRSVSVLLLHLIVRHRLPLLDAFRYMRSCRSQVNPNTAFKLQLARLEVQELRYSSIAKDGDKAWDFYEWNR
jgi:protein-tyrosine phosphatase